MGKGELGTRERRGGGRPGESPPRSAPGLEVPRFRAGPRVGRRLCGGRVRADWRRAPCPTEAKRNRRPAHAESPAPPRVGTRSREEEKKKRGPGATGYGGGRERAAAGPARGSHPRGGVRRASVRWRNPLPDRRHRRTRGPPLCFAPGGDQTAGGKRAAPEVRPLPAPVCPSTALGLG